MCYGIYEHKNMMCNCGRHFLTKEEKIEILQQYKKMLEKEIEGINETTEELKKVS